MSVAVVAGSSGGREGGETAGNVNGSNDIVESKGTKTIAWLSVHVSHLDGIPHSALEASTNNGSVVGTLSNFIGGSPKSWANGLEESDTNLDITVTSNKNLKSNVSDICISNCG